MVNLHFESFFVPTARKNYFIEKGNILLNFGNKFRLLDKAIPCFANKTCIHQFLGI